MMNLHRNKLAFSLLLVVILAGCETLEKNGTKTTTDSEMLQSRWELTLLDGKTVLAEQPIYIELTPDNRVTGFVGCNRLTGSYRIEKGNQIRFLQLATTRMACPEMALEARVLEMLAVIDKFVLDDGRLTLSGDDGTTIAAFTAMDEKTIVNRYWKLKTVDGKVVSMLENQEREQFFILRRDNTVTGFAGCNHFSGEYQLLKENQIRFKTLATTMRLCPDVDLNEADFLNVFGLADTYTLDGNTLMLSQGGKEPLAVFESVEFK